MLCTICTPLTRLNTRTVFRAYCNHETLGQLTIRKLGNVLTDYKDGLCKTIFLLDDKVNAVGFERALTAVSRRKSEA